MRRIIFLENDDLNRHDRSGLLTLDGASDRVKGNTKETGVVLQNAVYQRRQPNAQTDKVKVKPQGPANQNSNADRERDAVSKHDEKYAADRKNKRMI